MNQSYPKSIFCIIATEFCERFSFCGLRTILSLYLRNELQVPENKATIVYHVFIMLCYIGPLIGAILADGYFGKFKTILNFSLVYLIGNLVMCLAATPPLGFPPLSSTMIGLVLIALGTGGIKPCVAAFGGDQFILPDEEKRLQGFFSIFYFAINTGGLAGMLATPALRKAVTCFGQDTCYSLGFGFPAILMLLSLIVFYMGKNYYIIKKPKANIMFRFVECSCNAIKNKCWGRKKLPDSKKNNHWLDYASEHYEEKLISDMKIVYSIVFLYIPLPLFWSLFDQQGSRWTFQASRTNGTISLLGFSTTVMADQMQVVNPAIVLILIPIFEHIIYPYCGFLQKPIYKMIVGGVAAGLAFIASGLLELQLQKTYPDIPAPGFASINTLNTLDCSVNVRFNVRNDGGQHRHFVSAANLKSHQEWTFHNINAINSTKYNFEVIASPSCNLNTNRHKITATISNKQVHTILIGMKDEGAVFLYVTDPVDFSKSLNGKPRLRVAYMHGANDLRNVTVTLKNVDDSSLQDIYFVADAPKDYFSLSPYMDLLPGRYAYEVESTFDFIHADGTILLELGGVYTLVIREHKGSIDFTGLYIMTLPNTVHMFWLLPQYFLISIGEIMFAISGLEFSFCQAPKSMKTIIIAAWYLTVALGNFLVILITQAGLFQKQSHEFFMFALMIFVDMAIFYWMSLAYVVVPLESDSEYARRTSDFSESERKSSFKSDTKANISKSSTLPKTSDETELEPLMSKDETRYDEVQNVSDSSHILSEDMTSGARAVPTNSSDKKMSQSRRESNVFSLQ